MRRSIALLLTLVTVPTLAFACSGGSDDSSSKNGSGSSDPGGGEGAASGILVGAGTGQDGGGLLLGRGSEACATESAATEAIPLDIYVMFDQSCSMSCEPERAGPGLCCLGGPRPRIDQVRTAMEQFLGNPASAGIGVGIGYFGNFPIGQASCNPTDYAAPAVPIAPLPGNEQALVNSLRGVTPTGETPTGAAIRGACTYATQWKSSNPGRGVVILLVTDGVPEAPSSPRCQPSLADAEAAATDCLTQGAQIPTYVLGVGANLDNLQGLAQAGGTDHAYLAGGTTDVSAAVLEALNTIRDSAAVPCSFQVPPPPSGETLNPARVNVTYGDVSGQQHLVPGVASADACGDSGGWYYEDPQNPTTLLLCQRTCDRVTAALVASSALGGAAQLDLQYGCETVVETQ